MTKHAIILNRLMAMPSPNKQNKQNRLFNHAARNGYKCASCNVVNPFLTVDHRLRKSDGGTDDTNNLQLLCLDDHRKKDNSPRKMKVKKIEIQLVLFIESYVKTYT